MEETGGPGENHRPVASHWQTLSHNDAWAFGHLLTILTMPLEQDNLLVLQNTIFQWLKIVSLIDLRLNDGFIL